MNDRKKHVIKIAHQLFVEKGFQNTSIQEILDYSGISKGTFYNYFSSKNELLIAIFKTIFDQLERERNDLLIGKDPSNIKLFSEQIELQMRANRANKLLSLFEEIFVSNDNDLKEFLKTSHLRALKWIYHRFIDIFGEEKKPYLFDCAIMFSAILNQNLKFHAFAYGSNTSIHKVVSYSVARIVKMIAETAKSGDQLIEPAILEEWLPDCSIEEKGFRQQLEASLEIIKEYLSYHESQAKYLELFKFIEDELFHTKPPRKHLIESVLSSIKSEPKLAVHPELLKLEQTIADFL